MKPCPEPCAFVKITLSFCSLVIHKAAYILLNSKRRFVPSGFRKGKMYDNITHKNTHTYLYSNIVILEKL